MLRAILFTQWKWSRAPLALAACAAFALPLLSMRGGAFLFEELDARSVLSQMQSWGPAYSMGALSLGLLVALIAWRWDHAGRHVYALSLPVERWRYVAMRFVAGVITLLGPVVTLWLGAMIAVQATVIPPGLEGYPTGLALRFLLAALLAYALCFAAGSTSPRVAGYVLGTLSALVIVNLVVEVTTGRPAVLDALGVILFDRYGLLHVFTGRWMLIDV